MKYNAYTPGTPRVSEIGLGAWQLGADSGWRSLSEPEAIALVHRARELGINFFDTAPNYGRGTSEQRLGKALRGVDRDQIVINTKFGHTVGGGTNFAADHIRPSVEGSLRRLQVDYVDSVIMHNPPADLLDGDRNPHYAVLERLREEGKLRAYGASLDTYAEMQLLLETTGARVIEAFFNILHQDTARAFDLARDRGVALIAKIPLDSGWLTGKYHAGSTFAGVRSRWSPADIKTRAGLVERVRAILGPDYPLPQAAIAFCLAYEAVATVIPGNTTPAQLRSNVESSEKPLPPEVVQRLERFYQEEVRGLRLPW